jgi:hypothetical protein
MNIQKFLNILEIHLNLHIFVILGNPTDIVFSDNVFSLNR